MIAPIFRVAINFNAQIMLIKLRLPAAHTEYTSPDPVKRATENQAVQNNNNNNKDNNDLFTKLCLSEVCSNMSLPFSTSSAGGGHREGLKSPSAKIIVTLFPEAYLLIQALLL